MKRRQRSAISRLFHTRNDKHMIATWKSDLKRILQIFNVRSVTSQLAPLKICSQTELAVDTNVAVSGVRHDVSNTHNILSETRNIVSDIHNIVSEICNIVSNAHKIVSNTHNIVSNTHNIASNTHNLVSDIHNAVSDTRNVVSDIRNAVSDVHNAVPDVHNIVSGTHNIVSDIHRAIVKNQEGCDSGNPLVSNYRVLLHRITNTMLRSLGSEEVRDFSP